MQVGISEQESAIMPPISKQTNRVEDLVKCGTEDRDCPCFDNHWNLDHSVLQDIDCEIRDGIALLHGTVSSFYHKQLVQEIARKTPGVEYVINRIVVIPPHEPR
jgi:hypothetical protein